MTSKIIKIGQISDLHIGESEEFVQGIDVRANFLFALNSSSMQNLDLLVLSGDLANEDAEPGAYQFIADTIKDYPVPVCIIPGNHDRIDVMQKYYNLEVTDGKCYYSFDIQGRRIFFIDSACGEVSREQLDWLEREVPKADGEVLLFMHHPPCFCNHRFMDLRYHLKNMVEVQQVLSKFKNLNHIFCGHYHHEFEVKMGNQYVHAAPSTQMQIDPNTPYFSMKSSAPGWMTIDWGEDFVQADVHF
jgi:Icc protein